MSPQGLAFVAEDRREELAALFVDLVAERGFAAVTLGDLADRARVDPEEVTALFEREEDIALAAVELAARKMFTAVAEAFLKTPGDCPLAARAALEAMLRFMAASPTFVHLAVVEYGRLGARGDAVRRRSMEQFAEFLVPGFAAADELLPQPEVVSLLIAGGIYQVLASHYLDGRLEELPRALPAVTYFTVAPFFGVEEARRVASLPPEEAP